MARRVIAPLQVPVETRERCRLAVARLLLEGQPVTTARVRQAARCTQAYAHAMVHAYQRGQLPAPHVHEAWGESLPLRPAAPPAPPPPAAPPCSRGAPLPAGSPAHSPGPAAPPAAGAWPAPPPAGTPPLHPGPSYTDPPVVGDPPELAELLTSIACARTSREVADCAGRLAELAGRGVVQPDRARLVLQALGEQRKAVTDAQKREPPPERDDESVLVVTEEGATLVRTFDLIASDLIRLEVLEFAARAAERDLVASPDADTGGV